MSSKICAPIKFIALAMVAVLLAGCSHPYVKRFKQDYGWTEARMISDGWLEGRPLPPQRVYCYDTIADIDCFSQPNPNLSSPQVMPFDTQTK